MKLPLPPGSFFDIVASSAGLVLIRQPSWPDRETPGVEFTVGNPATNEWVRIPRLDPQQAGRIYSMSADPATGEFKLLDNHNWRVYESSSRAWGPTLRMPDISETGELNDNTDTLGCLPFVWEHKGVRYRACAIADTYGKVTYKVWVWSGQWRGVASDVLDLYFDTMDGAGQWLGVGSMGLDKTGIYTDWSMALECQAEGNLVCLAGQCRHCYDDGEKWADEGGEPLPPVVYDLDRDEWMYVRAKSGEGVQYRRAVVYRPSLVKPSGVEGAVALDPEGGEGHKRKREQQPLDTVARIRQHRMRAFGIEAEVYEDIFFMT
ncbi:hypothetical protein SELMODRAFT_423043 [Selaginella moellendorffii]|uniref:Uncharacterized protein n=1 Tax=Selaginella moellendorffii TaxID=88036 RepID=D8SKD6_SELML|nr:hypothetical protein SELMODRAFT_423043 [Selaginella moellendorffii]